MSVHIYRYRPPEITVTLTTGGTFNSDTTYYIAAYFSAAWVYNDVCSIFSNVSGITTTSEYRSISVAWKVTVPIQSFADYGGGNLRVNATNHCLIAGNAFTIESGIYAGSYTVGDWIDYNSFPIMGLAYSGTSATTLRIESAYNNMSSIIFYIHTTAPFSGDPTQGTYQGNTYGYSSYPFSATYTTTPVAFTSVPGIQLFGSPPQAQGTWYPPPAWCKMMEKGKVFIVTTGAATVAEIKQACIDADVEDIAYVRGETFVFYGILYSSGTLEFTDMNITCYSGMIGSGSGFGGITYTRCQVSILQQHYGAYCAAIAYNSNFLFQQGSTNNGTIYKYPVGTNNSFISSGGLGAEGMGGSFIVSNMTVNCNNGLWQMDLFDNTRHYVNCRINNGYLHMYYMYNLTDADRPVDGFYISSSQPYDIVFAIWYYTETDVHMRNIDTPRAGNKKVLLYSYDYDTSAEAVFHRSGTTIVTDSVGAPLSGVTMTLENNQGTTGYTFTSNTNGEIGYEVIEQRSSQTAHTSGYATDIFYEDWVITISKDGYETVYDHSTIAKNILTKVILPTARRTKITANGDVLLALRPELGSASPLLKV